MRTALLLVALLQVPVAVHGQGARLLSVEPDTGKIGDMIGAIGDDVDKANVTDLYLTDGTHDFKVAILEQSAKLIKFKVPANVKPGRYSLMIKTGGPTPKLLEQPVRIEIQS